MPFQSLVLAVAFFGLGMITNLAHQRQPGANRLPEVSVAFATLVGCFLIQDLLRNLTSNDLISTVIGLIVLVRIVCWGWLMGEAIYMIRATLG